jgi:putative SOS response-associated peptidase YedK
MCASYGLDPRFDADDYVEVLDVELLRSLRSWAGQNANETLRPTGKNLRNLNPILVSHGESPAVEFAWWGYLVGGEPARFPSINTRSERLQQRRPAPAGRAVVPATRWFEMQKSTRAWYGFGAGDHELLGLAAVTQRGRTSDGASFTCYSIVMQPSIEELSGIHDRMPLLLSADLAVEWLDVQNQTGDLVDAALAASATQSERIRALPLAARP